MKAKGQARYTITEALHEGRRGALLRAIRNVDGLPVVLKVLDPTHSRPRDIERLKREYELSSRLDVPTVVRPLALETHEGMPAMVMEDFSGESLDHLLGAPMPTERFLELAIRIAAAVAALHERDIIHKNLNPQNILVKAATGQVMLADLGFASPAPPEHEAAESPCLIEGSLPYLSPEQTGRANREIDSRADLYALGVTFYEMLTGRLPFEARDPLEWVHYHIARAPPPPSELVPELPEVLSAIILKLLAKMAEDRYQTARGLQHDLERCLAELQARGRIDRFPLAEHDASGRFQIPQKLYGREDELAALLSAFERAVGAGAPELVLVSGSSGIGKSALVHELRKPIGRERGCFISGAFDRYKRDIPYSTIVQAFRELVLEILAGSEERIAAFRERLRRALGVNGQLIVDVIPQVELVMGRQPRAPDLPPAEAQNRFRLVFRCFIGVFARRESPLALFLDDLQWADSASLAFLQDLVTHLEVRHLLVIGAYRDNEVTPSHPLMLTLDEARKQGARVREIALGPLSREDLAALVGETLHCRREDAAPLSDLVHEKTAGNPFFAIQFLRALHEERLIEFDGPAGIFRWDLAKIRAKAFTDNVVDLMVEKLRRLPARTREALKQLACLGSTMEIAFLPIAHGRSQEETHEDLRAAVRAGLVFRTDGTYKFLHDRIREAAYSLIPEDQRAEVHLAIGRLLVSQLPGEAVEARVFDVANQMNHGVALITDPREREALCRLNAQAGRKAKAAIAYASARSYLAQATALLPRDAWSARYAETFALYLDLSECESLMGEFRRADRLFTLLLGRARSNPDRARVYSLRAKLHLVSGRYDHGLAAALEGLRLFGVTCPESDEEIAAAFAAESREVSANLRGRTIADLAGAPVVHDPDVRAIIGLLVDSLPCAYNVRPKLFPLNVVRALNFSLRYGNTEDSCLAYSGYALMLVSMLGDIPSAFQFSEMSLWLNERFNDRRRRGLLLHIHADGINYWRRHIATDLPLLERGFLACLEVGDLVYAGHIAFHATWQHMEKGDPLDEVLEASRRYADFARQSHNEAIYHAIRLQQRFVASLQGATPSPSGLDEGPEGEAASVAAITEAAFIGGVVYHHAMKLIGAYTYGQYAEALERATMAAAALDAARATPMEATYHFYFALTLAALYPQASAARRQEIAQTLDEELQKLKHWAEHCPENYLNRHALVSAEVARLKGDLAAMGLYEEAIRSAREGGFVQNEALAYELASRFYRARGCDRFADTYLRDARACYVRWGAGGKVQQIDQENPQLVETRPLAATASFAAQVEHLDLLSVVKASQTISSELVLDELIRTLLRVALEQGGAQRGLLILSRGDELSIEAEAALDRNDVVTNILPSVPVGSSPLSPSPPVPASLVRYAYLTKEHVILNDAAADAGKFSADPYFARERPRSVLCLPILRQTKVIGLLYLENTLLAGAFAQDRLTALSLLATQSAISVENALLLAKERSARAAAEVAERRSTFLAEAGEILSASLDYEETLARLGRMCVRSFCDWCVIDVLEGGEIRRMSAAHREAAKEPLLEELGRRHPGRGGSPHPVVSVLRSGEPLLLAEISDESIRRYCEDEEHVRLVRELGAQSTITVPLLARGHTIGALSVVSSARGRRYGGADLELVQEVARRAAIAIDNARLYRATQEAIRVREEFLTVAIHELNTPMTSLTLSLEAIDRAVRSGRSGDPQAMGRLVERALRQAARLIRLNRELLEVSQIHAGKLPLEVAEVDLGEVVREVIERFKPDLTRAGCAVSLRGGGRIVGLWDRARVDQIVTNLLANAIKFGAGKPIEISLGEAAGIATLVMTDHGIGIEPARQAQIFERFERAVPDTHYGGLGLGLYISRSIAEAHGGAIRVQSALGAGATFIVELPVAGPHADRQEPRAEA